MGFFSDYRRKKKVNAAIELNVITNDWTEFLKNYPLVSAKLQKDHGEAIKSFIYPGSQIKIYFGINTINFYLLNPKGKEVQLPVNILYNNWDEVSMQELDELLQ